MARKGRGKRSKFERRVPCEQKIIEKTLICITFLLKRRKSSRTSNKRNDGSSRRRKLSFRCGIIRNPGGDDGAVWTVVSEAGETASTRYQHHHRWTKRLFQDLCRETPSFLTDRQKKVSLAKGPASLQAGEKH